MLRISSTADAQIRVALSAGADESVGAVGVAAAGFKTPAATGCGAIVSAAAHGGVRRTRRPGRQGKFRHRIVGIITADVNVGLAGTSAESRYPGDATFVDANARWLFFIISFFFTVFFIVAARASQRWSRFTAHPGGNLNGLFGVVDAAIDLIQAVSIT